MNLTPCHTPNSPPLKYHKCLPHPDSPLNLYYFGGISDAKLNNKLYCYDVIKREFRVLADGSNTAAADDGNSHHQKNISLARVGMSMIFRCQRNRGNHHLSTPNQLQPIAEENLRDDNGTTTTAAAETNENGKSTHGTTTSSTPPNQSLQHQIIIYGGINAKRQHQNHKLLIYNLHTKEWKQHHFVPVEDEEYGSIMEGGKQETGASASTTKVPKSLLPPCISNHTALYHSESDSMLVFAGNDALRKIWSSEVYLLHLETMKWSRPMQTSSPESIPKGRCGHSASWIQYKNQQQMIIFGGTTQTHRLNDTWLFSLQDKQWTRINAKGKIPPPLNNHAAVTHKSRLYIYGGFPHNPHLYQLDLETETWTILHLNYGQGGAAPSARFGHTLTWIPNRASPNAEHPSMILYGGVTSSKRTLSDLYEFHAAEEHKYNLALQETRETLISLQHRFLPNLLSNQVKRLILQKQISTEGDVIHSLVNRLAKSRLHLSSASRDASFNKKQKPLLMKKLAESVAQFKELNKSAKYHTPKQKQLASSLQALIGEYVAQHRKMKQQALIVDNHELVTFYNRVQVKLCELFLRYHSIEKGTQKRNKRASTSFRISTHMISSEAIELADESFHLLLSASKHVCELVEYMSLGNDESHTTELDTSSTTSGFSSLRSSPPSKNSTKTDPMMGDLRRTVSTIEVLCESFARALTLRYSEQIQCLSTSLSKPATYTQNDITLQASERNASFIAHTQDDATTFTNASRISLVNRSTDHSMIEEDDSIVHDTDSEDDEQSRYSTTGSTSTISITVNPPGGCEMLADCAVKHVLYFLESSKEGLLTQITSHEDSQLDMNTTNNNTPAASPATESVTFPPNMHSIQTLVHQFLTVVFRGGNTTGFSQQLEPTALETDPKLRLRSQWTDIGVFRHSGIKIEEDDASQSRCFASIGHPTCCGLPHIYRFRTGTLEEVRELALSQVDPNFTSQDQDSTPSAMDRGNISESDRMRELINDLKVQNAQLRKEQDQLLGIKREFEQYVEKTNADRQVEASYRQQEVLQQEKYREQVSRQENKLRLTIQERETEIKVLTGKVKHLEEIIQELQSKVETTTRYNKELKERLEDLHQLEQKSREQQREIDTLLHYKARVEGKRKKLPGKVRTLEDSVQSLKAAIRESKKMDYDELSTQLKDLKKELAQKHLEVVQATQQHQEFRAQAQLERSKLEEQLYEYKKLATDSKKSSENLEDEKRLEVEAVRQTLTTKIEALERNLNEKQELLNRFTIERAKMVTTEQSLREELETLRESLSGNEHVKQVQQEMEAFHEEKKQLEEQLSTIKIELSQCKDQLVEKTQHEAVSHEQVEHIRQEKESLLERIGKLKTVQRENKSLRAEVTDMKLSRKSILEENEDLKEEVQKMSNLIVNLQNRLAAQVNGDA